MSTKRTNTVKDTEAIKVAPVKENPVVEVVKASTSVKNVKTAPKAKEKDSKVSVTIEFQGNNTVVDSVVESIKAAYKADGNTAAIETLEVYVQPENGIAYYVVNGVEEGKSVNL